MINKKISKNLVFLAIVACFIFYSIDIFGADIIFVLPKTLKVESNEVTVKGTIMDFSFGINKIDFAVVNLIDLIKEKNLYSNLIAYTTEVHQMRNKRRDLYVEGSFRGEISCSILRESEKRMGKYSKRTVHQECNPRSVYAGY